MGDDGLTLLRVEDDSDAAAGRLRAIFVVDAGARWFDGHFPGAPVLPAIAHFDLLCRAHRAAGGAGRIAALDRVRLAAPVRPGDRLTVEAAATPSGAWRFALRGDDGRAVSDGLVRWAPRAGAAT